MKLKKWLKCSLFILSFKASAGQVVCRISGQTTLDSLQVVKRGGTYSIFLDGILQSGFECIDRTTSSYFDGVVQCRNLFGDMFQVNEITREPTDGYLKFKNKPRLMLACFDLSRDY